MPNHHEHANLIWQIADLLRGPYRPPQYERVMLPMTVLNFLRDWLVEHIQGEDKKYGPFLNAKGIS